MKFSTGLFVLAAFFVLMWILAVLSMLAGNPTAVNGVLGAGFGVVLFTVFGAVVRRLGD